MNTLSLVEYKGSKFIIYTNTIKKGLKVLSSSDSYQSLKEYWKGMING